MNKWVSNFMLAIRKFYGTENLAFLYSELLQELGGTAEDPGLIHKGNNAEYSSCDFERIVNSQWILSPREQWTRIQMYVVDGVLHFAKLIVFGRDTYVIITVLLFRRILMVGAIKLSFLIVYMLKTKLLEDLRLSTSEAQIIASTFF